MPSPLIIRTAVVAMFAASFVVGCSGSNSACSPPVREELDPSHLVHVTDPTTAKYKTDPPTSGVHLSTPAPTGVNTEAMLPAVQVTVLERGDVLVQYRDPADAAAANALVADRIVISPQPTLPARVVVTAWTYKLTCSAVDAKAINAFASSHIGKPQEH